MNIYHQGRTSCLKPPTPNAFLTSSEVAAYLDFVIPRDALLPTFPQNRFGWEFDGDAKAFAGPSEIIYPHTIEAAAPEFYVPNEIEPTPFHPSTNADHEDFCELVTPLKMFVEAFMPTVDDENTDLRPPTKKVKGKCEVAGCNTKKQSNGKCIRHGGGKRCEVAGCPRGAQTMGRCKRHGGGTRCTVEGCNKSSQSGGLCRTHGGGKLCVAPGCKKGAQRQGKCATHASQKCKAVGCLSIARCGGFCRRHQSLKQPK